MHIDRTHLTWSLWLLILTAVVLGLYAAIPTAATASSWQLLCFALVGSVLAIFCALLAVRKKLLQYTVFRRWRLLKSHVWAKGHIYGGLLSVLLFHLHGGFRMGGPCTQAMMVLVWAILGSGVLGLLFRQLQAVAAPAREGKAAVGKRIIGAGDELCCRLHIPLSLALLVLGVVHGVSALFF